MRIYLVAVVIIGSAAMTCSDEPTYNRDIRPILAEHCFACHGALHQKAGLRLDSGAFMRRGGESGEAVTPEVMKDLFATGLLHDPRFATDELVQERMQVMQTMNGHVVSTMQIPVLVERLGELDCPVLGFWGMDEKMMPDNGIMAMARNIRHLRLMLVTQCGHWVMVEHQDMFNRACLDFLRHD